MGIPEDNTPTASTESKLPPVHSDVHPFGEKPGDWIGPYKLMEVIGEGGFGTVWLAERREPMVQRVALKVIKPGMDSKAVIARFDQERQALAVMDHPNVAKVFDGGVTPLGRPYFVMEHVQGEQITTFCDRQQYSIRQRLELFTHVCEAVQHAHHKGIIHRDIKPSNVLVAIKDGQAIPKVIDFGVAKAISHTLTDHTIFTESGQLIGTPEYMSPEQAEMGATDIDTRTDVYSLGVVLYELVSGMLPFDPRTLRAAGYEAIRKVLREQDAPKPSTRLSTADDATGEGIARHRVMEREQLAKELRRELDWIPLKALRKDRSQRYDTPAELAHDIRRYLAGSPLSAGPESVAYRYRKLLRQNRAQVISVCAVLMALLIGLVGTSWQAWEASVQRNAAILAQRHEAEQRKIADANAEREALARERADAKTKEAEFGSYIANLMAAEYSLRSGEPWRVEPRLDACPESLRNWEWHRCIQSWADESLCTLKGHEGSVGKAAFDASASRIVTASDDGTACIWDVRSGSRLLTLKGHTKPVISAVFSPDGRRVLTGSLDSTGRVWDSESGTCLFELRGHTQELTTAVFDPDGAHIATASHDHTAILWEAGTGKELVRLAEHQSPITCVSFSPDGTLLVTSSVDNTVRVWDCATGGQISVFRGHDGPVIGAAFSPKGDRVVSTSSDGSVQIWEARTALAAITLRTVLKPACPALLSPDAKEVAAFSLDGMAGIWSAKTGEQRCVLVGHTSPVRRAAYSPDGKYLITGSWDNSVQVWDASTGQNRREFGTQGGVINDVAFDPHSARALSASTDSSVRVWDARMNGSEQNEFKHGWEVISARFSADGSRIITASTDSHAHIWDIATHQRIASIFEPLAENIRGLTSASFSPDGSQIVYSSHAKVVRVCDAESGSRRLTLRGHTNCVWTASYSPDGNRIVTGSEDTTARIWNAKSGAEIQVLRGHKAGVTSAVFSPDGLRVATSSEDESAILWDANSGQPILSFKGHEDGVKSVVFDPSGRRIATSSSDGTAQLWDAATGVELAVCRGHENVVSSVAFNPDGTRLVTASLDGSARVWDSSSGREVAIIRGHELGLASAVFSPDGTQVLTASYDETAHLTHSVPYRDRFASIERGRAAMNRISRLIQDRELSGETPEHALRALADSRELMPEELAVVRAESLRNFERQQTAVANEISNKNKDAWEAVLDPQVSLEDANQALANVQFAVERSPDSADYWNTVGAVHYRLASFEQAIRDIEIAEQLDRDAGWSPEPANLAIKAMSYFRLGQAARANETIAALRVLLQTSKSIEPDTQKIVEEAEQLIGQQQPK